MKSIGNDESPAIATNRVAFAIPDIDTKEDDYIGRPSAVLRSKSECEARSEYDRTKKELYDMFRGSGIHAHARDMGEKEQYRLLARKPEKKKVKDSFLGCLGLSSANINIYENEYDSDSEGSILCCGLSPNKMIINGLHFVLRNSFATFTLLSIIFFLAWSFFFALLIYGFGMKDPYCIGGVPFEDNRFVDSFLLSWTTFATVGYGVIYGGISPQVPTGSIHNCTGITIVLTLESFIGIMFSSVCGAVLFLKVSRIQSLAQIVFSDPILIRYGSGIHITDEDNDDDSYDKSKDGGQKDPCPILEFRIANRMNQVAGGELIDCAINIVASVDAKQASSLSSSLVKRAVRRTRRKGKKGKKGAMKAVHHSTTGSMTSDDAQDFDFENEGSDREEADLANLRGLGLGLAGMGAQSLRESGRTIESMDLEDPESGPRRVFAKVEPESNDHPFFKRVWVIRHVLNEESPLLNSNAREMVKRNGGFWPKDLNHPEGIRAAVQFDSLVISFSGLSNADGNAVYAQHIYDYGDISVGYSFCNMIYRDLDDEQLFVDMTLINDVMEQNGGGGEELENAVPQIANMKDKFATLAL